MVFGQRQLAGPRLPPAKGSATHLVVLCHGYGADGNDLISLAPHWQRFLPTAAFVAPNASNKTIFLVVLILAGFVEGIILVATPAMVRDFSPQLGRGTAMGFWTLGPVVGSLVVAAVASNTLPANLGANPNAWKGQFITAGVSGLVVFAIALLFLRELSPGLRDQLMVSSRDRVLIEARAANIDVEGSLKKPWRQVLHLDVIGSAFAISVFLLIYFAAVGFFVVYFTTTFGFTEKQANGIGNWFWAFDAGALIVIGLLSDRFRVRKPFMVIGAVGAVVMTIVFASRTGHPATGYYTFVWVITLMAVFLGIAYAPWMASFTETVEKRNPALTATGLAVWGWIIRVVVAVSIFVLPYVVSSTTPLVNYGTQVKTALVAVEKAPPVSVPYASTPQPLLSVVTSHATLFGELSKYKTASAIPPALLGTAVHDVGVPALLEANSFKAPLAVLSAHGAQVTAAAKVTPSQWKHWWWVCVAGELLFIPLIFVMVGRWSPARARRDVEAYERMVDDELAKLRGAAVT